MHTNLPTQQDKKPRGPPNNTPRCGPDRAPTASDNLADLWALLAKSIEKTNASIDMLALENAATKAVLDRLAEENAAVLTGLHTTTTDQTMEEQLSEDRPTLVPPTTRGN